MNKPLVRVLLYPSARELDACLREAGRLNESKENPAAMRAPEQLLELTAKCLATPIIEYKLYALFIWIILHPSVNAWFGKGVHQHRYQRWQEVLHTGFDMHLLGLRADGAMYKPTDDLEMAKTGVFVRRMVEAFAEL